MELKGTKAIAQQSNEDYLEAILMISKEKDFVRAVDLANALNYSRASVTVALKKLKEEKFVNIDESNHITLTRKGYERAKSVLYRHKVLTEFFIGLGIEKKVAEQDACLIEHIISSETFNAIDKELKKHEK